MSGPLATIWDVYQTGQLKKLVVAPLWVVLVGALGLVVGLATYGYNIVRAMGVRLVGGWGQAFQCVHERMGTRLVSAWGRWGSWGNKAGEPGRHYSMLWLKADVDALVKA